MTAKAGLPSEARRGLCSPPSRARLTTRYGGHPSPEQRAKDGGGRGIRTPGTVSGAVVFKTTAIDHSAIPPALASVHHTACFGAAGPASQAYIGAQRNPVVPKKDGWCIRALIKNASAPA